MPEISLTDFVDFTTRAGTPKLTKVRQLRHRGEYQPQYDFWRELRLGLVEFHRAGAPGGKKSLDVLIEQAPDARKALYTSALKGYRKFLGRKAVHWFEPPRINWYEGGLGIRINPELGLEINGVPTLIKVHFKSRKLSKRSVETILLLMEDALRPHCLRNERFAVLDISQGKLFYSDEPRWGLRPYLAGEARSFVTMWYELDRMERAAVAALWAPPVGPSNARQAVATVHSMAPSVAQSGPATPPLRPS